MSIRIVQDKEEVLCYCSRCKTVYSRTVEKSYLEDSYIWREDGYPVITCSRCASSVWLQSHNWGKRK